MTLKDNYICPLFWQHGEEKEDIIEEITQMHRSGINEFIVESRPHPDYLSYGWWRDLDIILETAKKCHMHLWIFDDAAYPSGIGAGKIKTLYPQDRKYYIAEHHIDAVGPMADATIDVENWLLDMSEDGISMREELIAVVLCRRLDDMDGIDPNERYVLRNDSKIKVSIPEGNWRIFIIVKTRLGGEDWTKDYVNPISKQAVNHYINIIYDEHYKRYKEEFGKTINGFFVDEPRFGNAAGYENTMWHTGVSYPYSDTLLTELAERYQLNFPDRDKEYISYLPFLWSDTGEVCSDIHECYMDVISGLFSRNFIGNIGSWCSNHGVELIGHFVEDNGVHAEIGLGPGHFFRAVKGLSMSGLDVVYQIWPRCKSGRFTTPFGYLNMEFFYWGIAKMASSAAHLDANKNGRTACEIFGAYGWQEGLRLMKWLTDHVCVRGVNYLIPHAFSPKYPDADCPPHFYAKNHNPQWPFFHQWSTYANRVCGLLTGGEHVATAAVLYHAEAKWCGNYMPFESAVHALYEQQIDCDVIPTDILLDDPDNSGYGGTKASVYDHALHIGGEVYQVLIIPYMEKMLPGLAEQLIAFVKAGLKIIFLEKLPVSLCCKRDNEVLDELVGMTGIEGGADKEGLLQTEGITKAGKIQCVSLGQLAPFLKKIGCFDILCEDVSPDLAFYHYKKEEEDLYFFVNENIDRAIDTYITFQSLPTGVFYDAMNHSWYRAETQENRLHIKLDAGESVFYLSDRPDGAKEVSHVLSGQLTLVITLDCAWKISMLVNGQWNEIRDLHALTDMSGKKLYPEYSGTYRYEYDFTMEKCVSDTFYYLDLGQVFEISHVHLNDRELGDRISSPYLYEVSGFLQKNNHLTVDVTNTFVNEKGDNVFDRAMLHNPSGLLGPVKVKRSQK